MLVFAPGAFAASCSDKVAELDRLIAENEDLSQANLQAVRMQRDLGAQYCEQGNETTANSILDVPLRSMRERAREVAEQKACTIPKSVLTAACLAGDWCVSKLQSGGRLIKAEGRYHFHEDGSFHVGTPPDYRLDKGNDPWPLERFATEDYKILISKEPDEFRFEVHGSSRTIFRRGRC